MQFGLFGGARTKRGVGLEDSQGYESFIDYVIEADRWASSSSSWSSITSPATARCRPR